MKLKQVAKTQLIAGAVGKLELRVKPSKVMAVEKEALAKRLVVISHPHPLYSGTMNNKVVTTLERAFSNLGFTTVAYNFRGVGQSEGAYDNGVGEQDDLKAVLDWAKETFEVDAEKDEIVLAGFSFGSYVTLQAHKRLGAKALCTVAPPVGLYDFSNVAEISVPWVLIQGGQDEVVSAAEILDWSQSLKSKPDIYWREKASHFFHGELIWLRKVVEMSF